MGNIYNHTIKKGIVGFYFSMSLGFSPKSKKYVRPHKQIFLKTPSKVKIFLKLWLLYVSADTRNTPLSSTACPLFVSNVNLITKRTLLSAQWFEQLDQGCADKDILAIFNCVDRLNKGGKYLLRILSGNFIKGKELFLCSDSPSVLIMYPFHFGVGFIYKPPIMLLR